MQASGKKSAGGDTIVDRGSVSAYDYNAGNFTRDNTWRDLDLSTKIPVGTKFVWVSVRLFSTATATLFNLRSKDISDEYNVLTKYLEVASNTTVMDGLVAVDANRVIQYRASPAINTINFTIRGWIL